MSDVKHPPPWSAVRAHMCFGDYPCAVWCVHDADGVGVLHFQINQDYPEDVARELAERIATAVNGHAPAPFVAEPNP